MEINITNLAFQQVPLFIGTKGLSWLQNFAHRVELSADYTNTLRTTSNARDHGKRTAVSIACCFREDSDGIGASWAGTRFCLLVNGILLQLNILVHLSLKGLYLSSFVHVSRNASPTLIKP